MKRIILTIILILLFITVQANAMTVEYVDMGVPNVDSSFKTWMPYTAITNRNSAQYKFISRWGWCDGQGFMRCSGEKELGVDDDYYLVALGSYYGTAIGTKYRMTTDKGNVFYAALADCKANAHTNGTNQYGHWHNDVIEFLVSSGNLHQMTKVMGNANYNPKLSGSIVKIEKMTFKE